ncbi:hypothetical protein KUTeg_010298 [Tegillarca granosa]|uniref:Uncharacterized protein n=1 Tax=Tegillarca granosa TaxID=220873 RepID=A0ABQ9F9F7_TEGGR|nr:hypothetical protein KUTeg_010298 [Tegillarca granosa]
MTREVPIEIFTEETSTDLLNPDVGDSSRFSREKIKENLVLIGRKLVVLAFSYVGLTCMVICYSLLGAVIFTALESLNEKSMVLQITQERQNRLKELWNITKHFNIFSEEDWIKKATGVIKEFEHSIYVATSELGWDGHTEEAIGELNWSFTGSLLYCVTVITTIDTRPKIEELVERVVPKMTVSEFRRHFRVAPDVYRHLLDKCRDDLTKVQHGGYAPNSV